MARQESAIFTNMCMVYDEDKVLVLDRIKPDWRGVVFPGGHVEPKESFVDSVIREVYEETGLTVSNIQLCGIKQFTHRNGDYRYVVLLYKTNCFKGDLKSSNEGKVFWIDRKDLMNYNLVHGFDSMLEVFENDSLTENYWWWDNNEIRPVNK